MTTNPMTRRRLRAIPALLLLAGAAACAPGYRYTDAPALQFRDFDYGFPVQTALSGPRVAYIDQGSGDQVLLLIHGLAGNAGFWRYNIPELAQHYRVIAVDLPGYGRSEKRTDYPYDMTFYAETLHRLIGELGVRQVVPVGHSMGGQIAMTLALRHPEQVSRLVLLAPAGVEAFEPGEGAWLGNVLTIKGMRENSEEAIRRNLSSNFYNWDDEWEWLVEERARMAKADEMDQFGNAVLRSVKGMLDEPTTALLPQVRHPAVIIYGKYDGLIPNPYLHPGRTRPVFEKGAAAMPDARLVEIDNAGHLLIIEKPGEVNRAIMQFLGN
jgi:pimeloyl-ACP methyl ester carboxylesterase